MYHKSKSKVHIVLHPELGDTEWDKIINGFIIILENMGKQKINKTLKKKQIWVSISLVIQFYLNFLI